MSGLGRLILLPMPLDPAQPAREVLPPATLAHLAHIDTFVVENARPARRFLAPLLEGRAIQSLELIEWNARRRDLSPEDVLAPLLQGRDIGLLSDAGCPAVADPGADLVAAAHRLGARVVPTVGPSAPLLALMASGMGGQRFAFAGYLPDDGPGRGQALRELEARSAASGETMLFIETPYRNHAMLDTAIAVLAPDTVLMSASGLTLAHERVVSQSVAAWRAAGAVAAGAVDRRVPAVFGLRAVSRPAHAGRTSEHSAQPQRRPRVQAAAKGSVERRRKPRPDLPRKPLGD